MKRFTQLTIVGLLATSLLLSGCASKWDQQMAALKKDPIVTATWEGIEFIGSTESENRDYKSPPPHIERCYQSTLPQEVTFQTILQTAQEYGWIQSPGLSTTTSARLTKTIRYNATNSSVVSLGIGVGANECGQVYTGNVQIGIMIG